MMCETACQTMMGYKLIENWHVEHPEAAESDVEIEEVEFSVPHITGTRGR